MYQVVHLQTHLPSSGNAAFRLHSALMDRGVTSTMLSLSSDVKTSPIIKTLGFKAQIKALINSRFHNYFTRNAVESYGLFSYPVIGNDVSQHDLVQKADIIYLHWVLGGFLNLGYIERLAKLNKPIIVFMHDMWAITGGCHHSFRCNNYQVNCAECPIFPEKNLLDLPKKEFKKKFELYHKYENLFFVSPSVWLHDLAKESLLTKDKPVHYIPNLVDNKVYRPFDKKVARRILNLDEDEIIIAFGAASPRSPYKGWKYLVHALELLASDIDYDKISVAIFGSGYDEAIEKAIPFKTKFVGSLKDDYSTALVYNAADVFIAPSLAETFGLVILEALRCETPVVAFNIGGIPDLIVHKENGYLAEYKNAEDLSRGIRYCLHEMHKGFAPSKFDVDVVIDSHLSLYKEMLSSVKNKPHG